MNNKITLKYSLLAGAIYFFCISIAHILGIKVPGLYIYYNVQSLQYQDQIISFLAFGWSTYFYVASKIRDAVPPLLLSGFIALIGLANINLSNDFNAEIESTAPFWIQFIILFIYIVWLVIFYVLSKQKK